MTTTSDIGGRITPAPPDAPRSPGRALPLGAVAALATGRPALHLQAEDEAAVRTLAAALEARFGPLPHLDVLEPAEGGPFELRVVLPGLGADAAIDALAALPGAVFEPAMPAGTQEACDAGLLLEEVLTADGLTARAWVDAEAGGVLRWERVRTRVPDGEPDLAALASELLAAVRDVDPALSLVSDRGDDTVQPFVHPHTGRYGVEVHVQGVERADLAGDVVLQRRRDVLAAIGEVIARRADHERLALAPDVAWEPGFDLRFLLWVVGPAAAARPGGDDLARPAPPVDAFLPAWESLFARVELQVVADLAHHDDAVLAVAALAETAAVPLAGGRARAVTLDGAPQLAACWDAPVVSGIDAVVEAIRALPHVRAARAVPAEPYGFADWPVSDAAWWALADGYALRIHDGRTDRDALPMVAPRDPELRDGAAMDALIAACADLPEDAGGLRTVADGAGRGGIELALPRACHDPVVLRKWLDALASAGSPEPTHVWFVGWRGEAPFAYRFWPHTPESPPPWGPSPATT